MLADSYFIPDAPVPLNSKYYIQRPIEQIIYQQICKEGSLIRIKAPKLMGKTSLVFRLIEQVNKIGYHTVYIDLQLADLNIFNELDKFLHWFCAVVGQQLRIPANFDTYWNEEFSSKVNCTIYFQYYLLRQINSPIVLIFNEINQIFEYPHLAENFLALLRSWYEEAKHNDAFKKLRLILVHSTEAYITLNTYQSPFNVGLTIKLLEFTVKEIQELAARYGLNWNETNYASDLKALVGGHPYLVQLALLHLVKHPLNNLQDILEKASTIDGIYSNHLQRLLSTLKNYPELAVVFQKLIVHGSTVQMDNKLAYKLESIGLVKIEGNHCQVSCELYRKFFAAQNFDEFFPKQDKQHINNTHTIDEITGIHNRRYLDAFLDYWWRKSTVDNSPLSLIMFDIDNFRIYNAIQGQEAGDRCLWQVANLIRNRIDYSRENILVARYQDDAFALILPGTTACKAFEIAESICEQVKTLAIKHVITTNGMLQFPIVTVSIGVASTIPDIEQSSTILTRAAITALNESKKSKGDCTLVSSTFRYGFS